MEAQQCVELTGTNTPITHTTLSGLVCAGKLQRVFDETTLCGVRVRCAVLGPLPHTGKCVGGLLVLRW